MRTLAIALLLVAAALSPLMSVTAQDAAPQTEFNEQNSGGHMVEAANVDIPEGGFLAIHDATLLDGNVLGSVIGVSDFLESGSHAGVRVHLTRALEGDNETLIAMPHRDTNANHIYDFVSSGGTADGPYTGGPDAIPESFFEQNAPALAGQGLGGISAVPQKVNVSAYLSTSAQLNSGHSVIIDLVDLSAPGYVAIHDATLVSDPDENGVNGNNVLSSVVGVSDLLEAGIHRDVVVALGHNCEGCKTDGNMSGTLIPMAHRETNDNAAYDFVSSGGAEDGPYTGQPGAPLTAVINVVDVTYSNESSQTFPAQATGGHIVLFPQLFVPEGGYAAVHDETLLDGQVLSSVIGVSEFLEPGIHRNVTVTLDFDGGDGIAKSQTLVGMLHRETNNNTAYDFVSSEGVQDGPYTGGPNSLGEADLPASLQGKGLGGVSAAPAQVDLGATVRIAAYQNTSGERVRIEYADFHEPGFVALHDASLLADAGGNVLSSVVGVSEAITGLQRDFDVGIPGENCEGCVKDRLNISQMLIAMAHKDSNENGAYDFITSGGAEDGPVVTPEAAGNTVSALGMNIVVSVGHAIVTNETEQAKTPATPGATPTPSSTPTNATPANGTPSTGTPTGSTPTGEAPQESRETNDTPGFTAVLLLAALGIALFAATRKRSS